MGMEKYKNYNKAYKEYKTEKQWAKLKKIPKKGVKATVLYANRTGCEYFEYYSPTEVRDMNHKELQNYRDKKNAEAREYRKRIKEIRGKELKTAYQWLQQESRIPIDGAQAIPKEYEFEYGTKIYYYYKRKDVHKISNSTFKKLKDLYIKLYDGWETIDLDNSTYNGKIWW